MFDITSKNSYVHVRICLRKGVEAPKRLSHKNSGKYTKEFLVNNFWLICATKIISGKLNSHFLHVRYDGDNVTTYISIRIFQKEKKNNFPKLWTGSNISLIMLLSTWNTWWQYGLKCAEIIREAKNHLKVIDNYLNSSVSSFLITVEAPGIEELHKS